MKLSPRYWFQGGRTVLDECDRRRFVRPQYTLRLRPLHRTYGPAFLHSAGIWWLIPPHRWVPVPMASRAWLRAQAQEVCR